MYTVIFAQTILVALDELIALLWVVFKYPSDWCYLMGPLSEILQTSVRV